MKLWQTLTNNKGPRCGHTHKDGTHCKAHAQKGNQYCFFHDPAKQGQRRQASSAGGRAATHPPRLPRRAVGLPPDLPILSLKTASDVASLLEETTNQVRHGQMDLRAATTICYIANSLLHALEVDARAERAAAPAPSKKHPAPLSLTVYDHTGRIIDQIPPDAPPAPFPRTASSNTPPPIPIADQGMSSAQREQSRGDSGAPGTGERKVSAGSRELFARAKQRSVAEPLDKTPTASSNTPSPSVEQGMTTAPSDKSRTAQPSAPLLRTENREPRTVSTPPPQKAQPIHYPPGMGPRHLGPGPGGSLMAGTPLMPWWRRERLNKAT